MTVGIITNSVSALPRDKVLEYNIRVVPVPFSLDGHNYFDGVDLPATEIYNLMAYEMPFRTSSPPPADFAAVFREVAARSSGVICLTVSRKISMMYLAAVSAANELAGSVKVYVVDSGTAAGAQALIDLAVARAAAAGASVEECVRIAEEQKRDVYLYGVITEPKYLARTGRVPSLIPRAASLIGIKPVISIRNGTAGIVRVVRTAASGVDHMLQYMREKVGGRPVRVVVEHANAPAEAVAMQERVEKEFNCIESYLSEFSPVMGYATGPGTLVLAFTPAD